jgi:hypothetical protein
LGLAGSRVFLNRVTSGSLPRVLGLLVHRNRHWNRRNRASGDPWRIESSRVHEPLGFSLSRVWRLRVTGLPEIGSLCLTGDIHRKIGSDLPLLRSLPASIATGSLSGSPALPLSRFHLSLSRSLSLPPSQSHLSLSKDLCLSSHSCFRRVKEKEEEEKRSERKERRVYVSKTIMHVQKVSKRRENLRHV